MNGWMSEQMSELRETDGLSIMAESKFETRALILNEVAFHPARGLPGGLA